MEELDPNDLLELEALHDLSGEDIQSEEFNNKKEEAQKIDKSIVTCSHCQANIDIDDCAKHWTEKKHPDDVPKSRRFYWTVG